LPVEQELESRLETTLRRMFARRQPLAGLLGHGDVVTSFALSFADHHLENERIMPGSPVNLDHVDLLGHLCALDGRTLFSWRPRRRRARLDHDPDPATSASQAANPVARESARSSV